MYKKIIILVIIISWLFVPYSHAWMVAPYLNITVNKTTAGGDGSFNFHIQGYNPVMYFTKDFNLQTTNGFNSYTSYGYSGGGDTYYITEDVVPGWQITSADCTSTNASITFHPVDNGVFATVYPYSSITCNFINTKQNLKTPVLIIPGVLGTNINKGNEKLWLDLGRNLSDVGDEFMDPLQFQTNLSPLDDLLSIGEVVGKPNILFDYSDGLIQEFQNQGYTQGATSDATLFTFPYDWRYGVSGKYANGSTTADILKQKIDDIRTQTGSDKVDVIAHSTGGLLVKQYVINHPADNHIGKAVFVGVPNTGAPKAIKTLLEGDNFGIPWLADSEMQKIAKNLPVVYDLMPSGKYYSEKNGPVKIFSGKFFTTGEKELNYYETNSYLTDKGLNSQAVENAKSLHTIAYDNFDLRTAGVDLYAIDGCKTGTLSQVWDFQNLDGTHVRYDLGNDIPGDGTVPLESATNLPIDESHKYYSLNADHGKMPSQDGIRQEIVNIISGSQLSTQSSVLHKDLITQDIFKCKLNGKAISVYSPLNIDIVDQDGNHSGLLADGVSIQNDIPNADFEISGEHKFVYLPDDEGQTYTINLKGTDNGTFTIKDQDINDSQVAQTEVFFNLPVTPSLTGQVNLGSGDNQTTLSLLATPNSVPVVVTPDSTINAEQSLDITPPVSMPALTGTMGQVGFYRTDVKINISATDPVVDNNASTTSGILKTQYSLDNNATTTYQGAIIVASEGAHTISFFSTDKAGNNEKPQTINFTIDKTAPEAVIQFDPSKKDIRFTGIDNISTTTKVSVQDNVNDILLTDQAGNTTDIKLKEKNRKVSMKSTIQSLSYNGISQDISKNTLAFLWAYDKNNNLTMLSQNIAAKKTYVILAVYNGKKTSLVGLDKTGVILKSITGLDLLKVTTNKGDLAWSY
jgi:Lecithin:cholesterol acyltransferase